MCFLVALFLSNPVTILAHRYDPAAEIMYNYQQEQQRIKRQRQIEKQTEALEEIAEELRLQRINERLNIH